LLIKKGKYHHLCARRTELFPMEFPGMERLASLNRIATEFKLRPTKKLIPDIIEYWHAAVREYTAVLGWYLSGEPLESIWNGQQDDSYGARTLHRYLHTTSSIQTPLELVERVEMSLLGAKCADWFALTH